MALALLSEGVSSVSTESEVKDRVPAVNDKPEGGTSGLSEAMVGVNGPPIIAKVEYHASGNHFLGETAMAYSSGGFTKVARSLREHPAYHAASLRYRLFIRELMDLVVWKTTVFYIGTKPVTLQPGQCCYSVRVLAKILSYENDPESESKCYTPDDIRGAQRFWEEVGFLRQEVLHGKTVLTIIYSAFCDISENKNPTQSPTELPQSSHTKEDSIDIKKNKKSSRRTARVATADGMRLCEIFVCSLKNRLPSARIPVNLNSWACEFDILLRDQSDEKIVKVLTYLPDCYYHVHVQCGRKFREEFARIEGLYRQHIDGPHFNSVNSRRHTAADGTPITHELEGVF